MSSNRTFFGASRLTAVVAAAALFAGASSQAKANLISDGDFNNSNALYNTTSGPIGPWTVTQGNVDLIGGYWQSPSGPNAAAGGTNGSVDLDGLHEVGGVSQSVTLAAGKYELTFALSGNPDGTPTTKDLSVTIGGVTQPFTYTDSGNTHANMKYAEESLFFTIVTGGTYALGFTSKDAAGSTF